jgi:D-sedoheptulose 7-phosphate isomerase
VARHHGATTIGFTGDDGGRLKEMVDVCVQVPSPRIEQQEDAHLILEHCICSAIREELKQRRGWVPQEISLVVPQPVVVR